MWSVPARWRRDRWAEQQAMPLDPLPKWNEPAIRVLMMPRDTNAHGTIFGGVILSYIDQAGALEARRQGATNIVTISLDKVVFHAPVHVGDLVSFWTETLRVGTTSITTRVVVQAQSGDGSGTTVTVTEAEVVYVNLGRDRRPTPIVRQAPVAATVS